MKTLLQSRGWLHVALGVVVGLAVGGTGTFALANVTEKPTTKPASIRLCVTKNARHTVVGATKAGKCPKGSAALKLPTSGTVGATGAAGTNGATGATGAQGAPGSDGKDGASASVSGPNVVLVGHSMLAGATSSIVTALPHVTVTSLAVGGESASTIAARWGSLPERITLAGNTIPASGTVDIAAGIVPWPLLQGPHTYAVHLQLGDGTSIAGTLSLYRPTGTGYSHAADDVYRFTRATAGTAITLTGPVLMTYDLAESHLSDIPIYWPSRNGAWTDATSVRDRLDLLEGMIGHQSTADRRFLVLGETYSATDSTAVRTAIADYNTQAAARFGDKFIDLQSYLVSYGLADAGITPTAQDQTDIAAGTVPTSLRNAGDALHLNAAGSGVVARLIRAQLTELGWYS